MKKLFFLLGMFSLLLLSSCASISGLQDARAVGENRTEVTGVLSLYKAPNFDQDDLDAGSSVIPILIPIAELSGRYGINERFDVGIKLNSVLNTGIHAKYQFLGDRSSKIAMAVGGEVGIFGLSTSLVNLQLPLFFSYHPSEKVSLYLSPRYVYQTETSLSLLGASATLNYLGGNVGLMFGTKHKFGIDVGYYGIGEGSLGKDLTLFSVGLGGKFSFGGDDAETEKRPTKKKKMTNKRKKRK